MPSYNIIIEVRLRLHGPTLDRSAVSKASIFPLIDPAPFTDVLSEILSIFAILAYVNLSSKRDSIWDLEMNIFGRPGLWRSTCPGRTPSAVDAIELTGRISTSTISYLAAGDYLDIRRQFQLHHFQETPQIMENFAECFVLLKCMSDNIEELHLFLATSKKSLHKIQIIWLFVQIKMAWPTKVGRLPSTSAQPCISFIYELIASRSPHPYPNATLFMLLSDRNQKIDRSLLQHQYYNFGHELWQVIVHNI